MKIVWQFSIALLLVAAVGFLIAGFYYEINYSPLKKISFSGSLLAETLMLKLNF